MSGRRALEVAGIAVAALIALNLGLLLLDRATGSPGGPTSSSFATGPDGLAAYADLVARSGRPVSRLRQHPRDEAPDPSATVVVLDPAGLHREDGRALRRFAEAGGRLVAGGAEPGGWFDELLESPPSWGGRAAAEATPLLPVAELRGVREVRTAAAGAWEEAGEALPLLAGPEGALLAAAPVGHGRVLLLADASPLQNRLLGEADNAALGLALAGESGRPVHFLESVHGYGRAVGLAAIPPRWRWLLAGLVLAALVWMLARGRRLGPPERRARALPPPRQEFVESLGSLLERTRDPAALEPVRAAARARLAARARVPEDDTAALRRAGEELGLGPAELAAVLDGSPGREGVLAAGRALAALTPVSLRGERAGGAA